MTSFNCVLFVSILFCMVYGEREVSESKSSEFIDSAENITEDHVEDNSASIQIHKAVSKEKIPVPVNDVSSRNEDNPSQVIKNTNSTKKTDAKYDKFFEDLISDSGDEEVKSSPEGKIKQIIRSDTTAGENNDSSNRQDEIEIVYEHISPNQNPNEEDTSAIENNEEDNNWRSAENLHATKDFSNEEDSLENDEEDFSGEDYGDKKISVNGKGRMEPRDQRRKEHMRPVQNMRRYGPPDDSILDAVSMRSLSEIVVPRYRPTLTRNGIVYTPTLYTVQTSTPMLDRLPGRNWIPNRAHLNPEREIFPRLRNKIIGLPHYETDSKIIDDYNDYGTNTYSYTPAMKRTTPAPPAQAPNQKFDIYQKLVDASNQPNLSKRMFSDNSFPGNFYQRQYADSNGLFDVRRFRRETWNEQSFQDI